MIIKTMNNPLCAYKQLEKSGYESECDFDSIPSPCQWPIYQRAIHVHETDKDGVVHFSNYLRISEEAMFSGFRALGCAFENSAYSVAMHSVSTNYFHPLRFGDKIEVILMDCSVKRVKFSLAFEFRLDGDVRIATVQLTLVTILRDKRKSIPLPAIIQETLSRVAGCVVAAK